MKLKNLRSSLSFCILPSLWAFHLWVFVCEPCVIFCPPQSQWHAMLFKCYAFLRPLIKGILNQSVVDWQGQRPFYGTGLQHECARAHIHTQTHTHRSLTSKSNKSALSQDPHCQVSQQIRSICSRWCPVQVPACMPQWQILFLFIFKVFEMTRMQEDVVSPQS